MPAPPLPRGPHLRPQLPSHGSGWPPRRGAASHTAGAGTRRLRRRGPCRCAGRPGVIRETQAVRASRPWRSPPCSRRPPPGETRPPGSRACAAPSPCPAPHRPSPPSAGPPLLPPSGVATRERRQDRLGASREAARQRMRKGLTAREHARCLQQRCGPQLRAGSRGGPDVVLYDLRVLADRLHQDHVGP